MGNSAIEHLPGGVVSRGTYPSVVFASCFALGALSVFLYPLNHDVSWILYMAEQVRGGARLYVDIVELNPPLIIWLSIPVSAAADLTHTNAGDLFRLCVLALALACMGSAAAILRGRLTRAVELTLWFLACYATVGGAGYDFGQREHIAVLLSMPYLAMAVLRLNGETDRPFWLSMTAVLAAVGFAFKPYLLLVPFLVESLVVLKTRSRPDCSVYAIAAVTALYLAAILLFAPEYLPLAKMVARVYGNGYLGIKPFDFLSLANFQLAMICIAFAWMVRPAPDGVFHVLLAAALGFAGAALIQNKGWSYHWYPVAALGYLLMGLAAHAVMSHRISSAPVIAALAAIVLCTEALVFAPYKGRVENPAPAVFAPVIKELGGGPVMVFSNTVRVSYPLVTQAGVGSSSRLPTMALLSAAINSKDAEFEKYLRGIVIADMVRKPPRILIAESRPADSSPSFDFIDYLSSDPGFAREMAAFRLARSVANFRFYQRVKLPGGDGAAADTNNE